MPLDINQPIDADSIFRVTQLGKPHPVYLLEGWTHGTGVVVKIESMSTTKNVKSNAMIMRAASPGAITIPLKPAEVQSVVAWCKANPDSEDGRDLALRLPLPGTWIKMKIAQNLIDLADAANKARGGDKADVRKIAKALNAPGGLEALGGIIAADAFNSNNDRFVFDGGGGCLWPPTPPQTRLKCLLNVGNVFVASSETGKMKPVGLDTWDPGSSHKNLREKLDESGTQWPGRMLADSEKTARLNFAALVEEDMDTVLGPRNRKNLLAKAFFGTARLGSDADQRIARGIEEGAKKIRAWLKTKYGPGTGKRLPVGLATRLAVLKWLSSKDFPML